MLQPDEPGAIAAVKGIQVSTAPQETRAYLVEAKRHLLDTDTGDIMCCPSTASLQLTLSKQRLGFRVTLALNPESETLNPKP